MRSKKAQLNSCETPIYSKGYVYWCGNDHKSSYQVDNKLKVYKYKV